MFELFKVFKKKSFKVEYYTSEQSTEVSIPTPEDRLESFSKLSESLVEEMLNVNNMFKDAVLKSNKMEILSDHETSYLNSEFEKVTAYDGRGNDVLSSINYNQLLPIEDISKMYYDLQFTTFMSVLYDYYYMYERRFDFEKKNSFNYLFESLIFYDVKYDSMHFDSLSISDIIQIAESPINPWEDQHENYIIDQSTRIFSTKFKENTIMIGSHYYNAENSKREQKKRTIEFKESYHKGRIEVIITNQSDDCSLNRTVHILKIDSPIYKDHNINTLYHFGMITKSLSELGRELGTLELVKRTYLNEDVKDDSNKFFEQWKNKNRIFLNHTGTKKNIEFYIENSFHYFSHTFMVNFEKKGDNNLNSIYKTINYIQIFLKNFAMDYQTHTLQINDEKQKEILKEIVPDLFDISPIKKYLLEYQKIASLQRLKEAVDASDIYDLVNILMPYIERLKYVILPSIKNLIKLKLEKEEPISKSSINEDEILFSRLDSYYSSLVDEIHTIINLSKQKEISIMHDTDELVDSFISYKKQKQMFHVKQVEEEHIFNDILDNVKDLDKE
ncbi:hypothetical protein [Enterococcus casseliflavus]|uniref:hypothetical protein n=1 Tax=Enterococcus casseliflavus TaxID=37734 RepID=UPI00301A1E64